jgi:hypothetical protein
MGKKTRAGREWMSNGSMRDPESSSQESIIGMNSDHGDFVSHGRDRGFVTRTINVR